MSKYHRVKVLYRRADILAKALKRAGFAEVEVHQTPQALVGYEGRERREKAHVIVRRAHVGGSSNDLGWVFNENTGECEAIVSEFDQQQRGVTERLEKVAQFYGVEAIMAECISAGLGMPSMVTLPDGTIMMDSEIPEYVLESVSLNAF